MLATPAIGGPSLSSSYIGMFLVFVYMWLPFMILPMAAALERVPGSLLQASADLGARPAQTFRNVVLPLAVPGIAAGSVFTFSLTLGDYIIPERGRRAGIFHRHDGVRAAGHGGQHSAGRGVLGGAHRADLHLSIHRQALRSLRCALTDGPTGRRGCMRIGAFAGLAFMHIPVLIIILYAFTTEDRTYQFPPPGLTLRWFEVAFARADIWQALTLSLGVAACATVIALVLGTLAAFALARSRFPGQGFADGAVRAAHRAARHHHRHRAAGGHEARAHRAVVPHHRCRPRDLLHWSSSTTT